MKHVIHILPNAHIDPVWMWDGREGMVEAVNTCRSVLDLMDEFPQLTFIRGESFIYRMVEKYSPETFERIRKMVQLGRWDIVGGTYVQMDDNMTGTETFCRHFCEGIRFFSEKFGVRPETVWSADAFGHSGGLPEVYRAAGMKYMAFTRPDNRLLPLPRNTFFWRGQGGAKILCARPYGGWYNSERTGISARLTEIIADADLQGLTHIGFYIGMGNHGGGPTRGMIHEIEQFIAQYTGESEIVFSTHSRFFAALEKEIAGYEPGYIPEFTGELNHVLRGCYASVGKLKKTFRQTESVVSRAEIMRNLSDQCGLTSKVGFEEEWNNIAYNSFHDILPGTLIERAADEEIAMLHQAETAARDKETEALFAFTKMIDTRRSRNAAKDMPSMVGFVVFNPQPFGFEGMLEQEISMDGRPLWRYIDRAQEVPIGLLDHQGSAVPFQVLPTEHTSIKRFPWRKRVVFPVSLPPGGYEFFELGYLENPPVAKLANPVKKWSIDVDGDQVLLHGSRRDYHLHIVTYHDVWGSWGGMNEEEKSVYLDEVKCNWDIVVSERIIEGDCREVLAVRLRGGDSELELRFTADAGSDALEIAGRLLIHERCARIKLVLDAGDRTVCEVPGGLIRRGPDGEVGMLRYAEVADENDVSLLILNDGLYNCRSCDGIFMITLARAGRYANDEATCEDEDIWNPVVDRGEMKFRIALVADCTDGMNQALRFGQGLISLQTIPEEGEWPKKGSLYSMETPGISLLGLKKAADGQGHILHVAEFAGRMHQNVPFRMLTSEYTLDEISPRSIAAFRLHDGKAVRCDLAENNWDENEK